MEFWEAMRAVNEGKHVRRSKWADRDYLAKDAEFPHTICHYRDGKFVGWWIPIVWDMTASDWEVVE